MIVEVKIPEVGESVTEGLLVEWTRSDGEVVQRDDELLMLETDKITMSVNAASSGRLKIDVEAGATVEVGQVVGTIDTDAADSEAPSTAAETAAPDDTPDTAPGADSQPPASPSEADQAAADGAERSGPAARRLLSEHDLDPAEIRGTGKAGRIVKEDVLRHLSERPQEPADSQPQPAAAREAPDPPESQPEVAEGAPPDAAPPQPRAEVPKQERPQTRRPFSPLRQRLAERLVQVKQSTAMLTTFNEVDMSRVIALRAAYRERFKERSGISLGFMSFFVKATVDALKTVPEVNAFIDGDAIVDNHFYDIGIAVSTDKGLVVPVLRHADSLSMAEIETGIADLAGRAQQRKLELSDLSGGVFTISNGGVFGSLLSTPILNPPQAAILGMHTIKKRPVVVDDEIVIRPMMYLALSYDHRLIDGREAVTFLRRIVECVEDPERMLLEV